MILYTLFLAAVAFVGLLIEPTGRLYMRIARHFWGRVVLGIGGVKVKVHAKDDVDWKKTYIVCANHSSQMDIPALFATLEMPVRFLAKRSLFLIPIFGWSMFLARFIPVDRAGGKKAALALNNIVAKLKKGPSVIIFPEGTRSSDGVLKTFKSGAFVMAIKSGVPILPVAIKGSFDVLPKDTLLIKSGIIDVIIGDPIETAFLKDTDRHDLSRRVKDSISCMLSEKYSTKRTV
ncbi:MAG: 1-acyl-sn-glycerol-3-phosphate acyltransferase [Deltaproteobacteria bacterium]|nr:1-acyl-sn-glycerol-3-phosphate acyltransferase [Deltaproteobacteria bacterium]